MTCKGVLNLSPYSERKVSRNSDQEVIAIAVNIEKEVAEILGTWEGQNETDKQADCLQS